MTMGAVKERLPEGSEPLIPTKQRGEGGGGDEAAFHEFNGASFAGAVFNLSTTIVGAGIMALPATMKVLGLVPGLVMIVLAALLTDASIELLVRFSRVVGAPSYGAVMEDAFGWWGRTLLQVCVVVNNVGVMIVYMIIIDSLSYTSAISVALAVVFVVITAGIAIVKLIGGQIAMPKLFPAVPDLASVWELFTAVPALVTAYVSQQCQFSISGATSDRAGEGSWALPGLQPWKEEGEGDVGILPVSVFSSAEFLNAGSNRLCSSLDGNSDRLSWDSRTSAGGRRSRRNSSESLRSSWNKKLKVTRQHPFKLRTEQRGRAKEQQFVQKVQEMLVEEEKQRIHIAQGLPWTTDEPECLIKPPVKETTEPIDLVLHSDVRAVERAEFDQYVSGRNKFAEQLRLERERQQKLEEEEMIRQLRKELVPLAQPMPYFDRPFIPKRSTKPATVPKEPKFHPRPEKLSCNAWMLES